jgi:CRP-like cAMP-binding protein
MMVDLHSIKNAAILEGLGEADLDLLFTISDQTETRAGERLFTRGEHATTLYIAIQGDFALTLPMRELGEPREIVVEEKGALEAFGWSALVEPYTSIYSAYCTSDGAVLTLPADELQQLMAAHDQLGRRLSSNLNVLIGARVRAAQDLWIDEVEHSHARVGFWAHSQMNSRLQRAVGKSSPTITSTVWRRLTRMSHTADHH